MGIFDSIISSIIEKSIKHLIDTSKVNFKELFNGGLYNLKMIKDNMNNSFFDNGLFLIENGQIEHIKCDIKMSEQKVLLTIKNIEVLFLMNNDIMFNGKHNKNIDTNTIKEGIFESIQKSILKKLVNSFEILVEIKGLELSFKYMNEIYAICNDRFVLKINKISFIKNRLKENSDDAFMIDCSLTIFELLLIYRVKSFIKHSVKFSLVHDYYYNDHIMLRVNDDVISNMIFKQNNNSLLLTVTTNIHSIIVLVIPQIIPALYVFVNRIINFIQSSMISLNDKNEIVIKNSQFTLNDIITWNIESKINEIIKKYSESHDQNDDLNAFDADILRSIISISKNLDFIFLCSKINISYVDPNEFKKQFGDGYSVNDDLNYLNSIFEIDFKKIILGHNGFINMNLFTNYQLILNNIQLGFGSNKNPHFNIEEIEGFSIGFHKDNHHLDISKKCFENKNECKHKHGHEDSKFTESFIKVYSRLDSHNFEGCIQSDNKMSHENNEEIIDDYNPIFSDRINKERIDDHNQVISNITNEEIMYHDCNYETYKNKNHKTIIDYFTDKNFNQTKNTNKLNGDDYYDELPRSEKDMKLFGKSLKNKGSISVIFKNKFADISLNTIEIQFRKLIELLTSLLSQILLAFQSYKIHFEYPSHMINLIISEINKKTQNLNEIKLNSFNEKFNKFAEKFKLNFQLMLFFEFNFQLKFKMCLIKYQHEQINKMIIIMNFRINTIYIPLDNKRFMTIDSITISDTSMNDSINVKDSTIVSNTLMTDFTHTKDSIKISDPLMTDNVNSRDWIHISDTIISDSIPLKSQDDRMVSGNNSNIIEINNIEVKSLNYQMNSISSSIIIEVNKIDFKINSLLDTIHQTDTIDIINQLIDKSNSLINQFIKLDNCIDEFFYFNELIQHKRVFNDCLKVVFLRNLSNLKFSDVLDFEIKSIILNIKENNKAFVSLINHNNKSLVTSINPMCSFIDINYSCTSMSKDILLVDTKSFKFSYSKNDKSSFYILIPQIDILLFNDVKSLLEITLNNTHFTYNQLGFNTQIEKFFIKMNICYQLMFLSSNFIQNLSLEKILKKIYNIQNNYQNTTHNIHHKNNIHTHNNKINNNHNINIQENQNYYKTDKIIQNSIINDKNHQNHYKLNKNQINQYNNKSDKNIVNYDKSDKIDFIDFESNRSAFLDYLKLSISKFNIEISNLLEKINIEINDLKNERMRFQVSNLKLYDLFENELLENCFCSINKLIIDNSNSKINRISIVFTKKTFGIISSVLLSIKENFEFFENIFNKYNEFNSFLLSLKNYSNNLNNDNCRNNIYNTLNNNKGDNNNKNNNCKINNNSKFSINRINDSMYVNPEDYQPFLINSNSENQILVNNKSEIDIIDDEFIIIENIEDKLQNFCNNFKYENINQLNSKYLIQKMKNWSSNSPTFEMCIKSIKVTFKELIENHEIVILLKKLYFSISKTQQIALLHEFKTKIKSLNFKSTLIRSNPSDFGLRLLISNNSDSDYIVLIQPTTIIITMDNAIINILNNHINDIVSKINQMKSNDKNINNHKSNHISIYEGMVGQWKLEIRGDVFGSIVVLNINEIIRDSEIVSLDKFISDIVEGIKKSIKHSLKEIKALKAIMIIFKLVKICLKLFVFSKKIY